jgi:hypothetical protein
MDSIKGSLSRTPESRVSITPEKEITKMEI